MVNKKIPDKPDELYLEFSRIDNRSHWEKTAYKRRNLIKIFTIAECLEDKGRFIPYLDNIMRASCAERTWVRPAQDRKLRNFKLETISITDCFYCPNTRNCDILYKE